MQLHHVAYLVRDTDEAIAPLAALGAQVDLYRRAVPSQKAFVSLLGTPGEAVLIELVEPFAAAGGAGR